MTITRFEDLQSWFNNNQTNNEEGKTPSHWTLFGGNYGEKEIRLMANTRLDNPTESLNFLVDAIRRMNNPDGAKFRVQLYKPGAPTNIVATTFVQIFERQQAPGAQPAAIGSLPSPMASESYINERIELALLKRENEDLRAAINGPTNTWERFLEILGQNEPLSQAVAGLIMGLANKGGIPTAPIPRPVAGSPDTDEDPEDETGDQQAVFAQNIHSAASILQTDPVRLAKALNRLVQQNPDMAKQLLTQI